VYGNEQQIINKIALKPRLLFLIDGLGAIISAFLLWVVLTNFESLFGMPKQALYVLSLLPCIFLVYDFICYFKITKNRKPFIVVIALANLFYCCISIVLVLQHYQALTIFGLAYFINELIILIVLVYIEFKVAHILTN
jgi:hypothetical protein